jgi:hypothetical protein
MKQLHMKKNFAACAASLALLFAPMVYGAATDNTTKPSAEESAGL